MAGVASSHTLPPDLLAVLADVSLQQRLGACDRPESFASELARITTELHMEPATGAARSPMEIVGWPPAGWLPVRSVPGMVERAFDWGWFGTKRPVEPISETMLSDARWLPLTQALRPRTSLAELRAGYRDEAAATTPSGFVYHMSRSGSTLLARMLHAIPGVTVASEPEPFDAALQWARTSGANDGIEAVRAVAAALGRCAGDKFIIKLDCWHTPLLPLLRAAFPDAPWVFVYRDPIEVMVSLAKQPAMQSAPGLLDASIFGIMEPQMLTLPEYTARMLASICAAALEHCEDGGLLVNYTEIHAAMAQRIPDHLGLTAPPAMAMAAVSARHAKSPEAVFKPDSAAKQAMATPEITAAAERCLRPVYEALETRRRKQAPP